MAPKNRNAATYDDKAVMNIFDLDDLLGFGKVGHEALIIKATSIQSCASSVLLAPGDHYYFNIDRLKRLFDIPHMPLDDECAPFHGYVIL